MRQLSYIQNAIEEGVMKNRGRFKNGLVPSGLGIMVAAGLLPVNAARASDRENAQTGAVIDMDPDAAISRSIFTRTSVLWSNPQWQEFKRLWRKLDSIGPADGDYSASRLDYEKIDKIRIELDNSLTYSPCS